MYDLIVIGAGSGGLAAAKRAANEKLSVLLIEEDTIGGTCVSYGCVPKKLWHGVAQCGYNIEKARQQGGILKIRALIGQAPKKKSLDLSNN